MEKRCIVCDNESISMKCSFCNKRVYCGEKCLEKDWKDIEHQKLCPKIGETLQEKFERLKKGAIPLFGRAKKEPESVKPQQRPSTISSCVRRDLNIIQGNVRIPGIHLDPTNPYNGRAQIQIAVLKSPLYEKKLSQKEIDECTFPSGTLKAGSKCEKLKSQLVTNICKSGIATPVLYHCARNTFYMNDGLDSDRANLLEYIAKEFPPIRSESNFEAKPLKFPDDAIFFIDNAGIFFGEYDSKTGDALQTPSIGAIFKYKINTEYQFIDTPKNEDDVYHMEILINAAPIRPKLQDTYSDLINPDPRIFNDLMDQSLTRTFFGSIPFKPIIEGGSYNFIMYEKNGGDGRVIISLAVIYGSLYIQEVIVYLPYSQSILQKKRQYQYPIRADISNNDDLDTGEF